MKGRYEAVLTWTLAFVLAASVVGVAYIVVTPQEPAAPYTEFYVLNSHGNASNYPTNLSINETGMFVVGVTNHEHRDTTYTVVISLENRTVTSRTATVDEGDTWEDTFSFAPTSTGHKRLWIRLYKGSSAELPNETYRDLRVWINVSNGTPHRSVGTVLSIETKLVSR